MIVRNNQIAHQYGRVGESFNFQLPNDIFTADGTITYEARISRKTKGISLSKFWINFDNSTRNFSGTPLSFDDEGALQIEVTGIDSSDDSTAKAYFTIVVWQEGSTVTTVLPRTSADADFVISEETVQRVGNNGKVLFGDFIPFEGMTIGIKGEILRRLIFADLPDYVLITNVDGIAGISNGPDLKPLNFFRCNNFKVVGQAVDNDPVFNEPTYGLKIKSGSSANKVLSDGTPDPSFNFATNRGGSAIEIEAHCRRGIEVTNVHIPYSSSAGIKVRTKFFKMPFVFRENTPAGATTFRYDDGALGQLAKQGFMSIVGDTYEYTNIDIDTETITLATPLTRDYVAGEECLTASGLRFFHDMEKIILRHNLLEDIDTEGFYIGEGFFTGNKVKHPTDYGLPADHRQVRLEWNICINNGYEPVQVKNSVKDVKIRYNYCFNNSYRGRPSQKFGLFVSDGTNAEIAYNYLERTNATGLRLYVGNNFVHHNVVIDSGLGELDNTTAATHAVGGYAQGGVSNAPIVEDFNLGGYFLPVGYNSTPELGTNIENIRLKLYNNTFVGYGPDPVVLSFTHDYEFANNLFVGRGVLPVGSNNYVDLGGNIITEDKNQIEFINEGLKDYRVGVNSIVRNNGVNLADETGNIDYNANEVQVMNYSGALLPDGNVDEDNFNYVVGVVNFESPYHEFSWHQSDTEEGTYTEIFGEIGKTFSNLVDGKWYKKGIRVKDKQGNIGNLQLSNAIRYLENPTDTVDSPTNFRLLDQTYDDFNEDINRILIDLAFDAPSNLSDNHIGYRIYRDGILVTTINSGSVGLFTGTTVQIGSENNPLANREIILTVRAVDGELGESINSNTLTITILPNEVEANSVVATSLTPTTARLVWEESNVGNLPITYKITRELVTSGQSAVVAEIVDNGIFIDDDVIEGGIYQYFIETINQIDQPETIQVSSNTITIQAPYAPYNLQFTSPTDSTIQSGKEINTVVGSFNATGQTPITYSIIGEDADSFNILENNVRTSEVFDDNAKSIYNISIIGSNSIGQSQSFPLVIEIIPELESATLSNNTIVQGNIIGDSIGFLVPNVERPEFYYYFNSEFADEDAFNLNENTGEITAGEVFDFSTKSSYNLSIYIEDNYGNNISFTVIINILESEVVPEPSSITLFAIGTESNGTNNNTHGYIEYRPENYTTRNDWPIWVHFPGGGETGDGSITSLQNNILNKQIMQRLNQGLELPFIVLAPISTSTEFGGGQMETFVDWSIEKYTGKFNPLQLHITIISGTGASGISSWLSNNPPSAQMVNSIGYLSSNGLANSDSLAYLSIANNNIRTWFHHGDNDGLVTLDSRKLYFSRIHDAFGYTDTDIHRFTGYAGVGHNAWNLIYEGAGRNTSQLSGAIGTNVLNGNYYQWEAPETYYDWMLEETNAKGSFIVVPTNPTMNQEFQIDANAWYYESFEWDFGDGNMNTIDINPTHTYLTSGIKTITLTLTNRFGVETIITNNVTVISDELVENQRVKVDFANGGSRFDTTWNHLGSGNLATGGRDVENLTNLSNLSSGISLNIEGEAFTTFGSSGTDGATTGNNSGVYPDAIMAGNIRTGFNGAVTGILRFGNLDPTKVYTFKGLSSRSPVGSGGRVVRYTIGELSKEVDSIGNTSELVEYENLLPDSNNEIIVTLVGISNNNWVYLNACELIELG